MHVAGNEFARFSTRANRRVFRLSKLMLTVVSGSVSDERVFSALEVVKGARRNSSNTHLECCVRLKAQTLFTLQSFPFDKALKCWHDKAVRCRYHAT
jgi:hypothetical protein